MQNLSAALALLAAALFGLVSTLGPCPGDREAESRSFRLDARAVAPLPDATAFAEGPVAMQARLDRGLLLAGGDRELFLCLYLAGAEELDERPRPGVNLALVIDRSGSMASDRKLDSAIAAAEQLVARLGPQDDLAIVAYDDEVRTLVPSQPVTERETFHAALATLAPGDTTNLHGGLTRGFDEVQASQRGERLNRVLLLSDGLANAGELTEAWQLGDVADGMRRRGVRVSTMGMGLQYDEKLMQEVAQRSGGNYHYIRHAEDIGGFLTAELDELARTVAKDAVVTLRLGAGVRVEEVYGHRFEQGFFERLPENGGGEGKAVRIALEDLRAGEQRRVLVRLRAKAGSAAAERLPVVRADLRYAVAATGETRAQGEPWCGVGYTRDHDRMWQSRDRAVWSKVEVVRNAGALLEAMRLRDAGQWQEARVLLSARIDESSSLNRSDLGSDEVDRILARLQRVHQDLERTAHSREAGRDLGLAEELSALGYM